MGNVGFIHDSNHSAEHETREFDTREFELVCPKLSQNGVIISDNADVTDCLWAPLLIPFFRYCTVTNQWVTSRESWKNMIIRGALYEFAHKNSLYFGCWQEEVVNHVASPGSIALALRRSRSGTMLRLSIEPCHMGLCSYNPNGLWKFMGINTLLMFC